MKTWHWVVIILIILCIIGSFLPENEVPESNFEYSFSIEETGEILDGEIIFNSISLGFTNNGNFSVPYENLSIGEFIFRTTYNESEYEFLFEINEKDRNLSGIDFVIPSDDLDPKFKDNFPNIKEPHWKHMPLTYNYEKECGERMDGILKKNIVDAISFIEMRTDGVVSFEKIESREPDIMFICSILKGTLIIAEANSSTDSQNRLIPGEIIIYRADECSHTNPNTIIHEVLHMFGLGHKLKAYTWDIMRTFQHEGASCNEDIAEEDIMCLKYIYSNGELGGNCSNTIFIDFAYESNSGCSGGWYPVSNSDYCCPEPNMIIDEEGYCAVGQEAFKLENFEEEYELEVQFIEEEDFGTINIDLTTSIVDDFNDDEKFDFMYDYLDPLFLELYDKINAENYKIIFKYRTEEGYIFNSNYETTRENIEKNLGKPDFFDYLESTIT